MDSRYTELAEGLVGFSTKVKKGERVLLDLQDTPDEMAIALIRSVRSRGADPFVSLGHSRVSREMMREGTESQYKTLCKWELNRVKDVDAYIAIRGAHNIFETSDVAAGKMTMIQKALKPFQKWRVNKTRWVVLRWPTSSMAQQAGMSTEAFTDFYFDVCTQDYSRMIPGMKALQKLMEKTDKVHIKGPGTDLKFSIKDIGVISCGGEFNIPDGEVFTAPVKDSVEGVVSYNIPSVYQGVSFENVVLHFKKGRIIKAEANHPERINAIFNTDAGARYIGEFAIGFHPTIREPMSDILFDEKIAGSFHFTPGQAYATADNGNKSSVHWDLVCIQRPDYGGGEIWFDGKLIRENGLFVPKSLQKLNPEYLLQKS